MSKAPAPQTPVCVITGGSSGIGLATARQFAAASYSVAICGRDEQKLAAACQTIREEISNSGSDAVCEAIPRDLSLPQAGGDFVRQVLENLGRIDVLVNNAGAAVMKPLEQISADDFEEMVSANIDATFFATQAAWQQMLTANGGVIVNVASQSARDPFPGFSVYGACKAWQTLFTQAIAKEGRPANIRAYAVLPGAVETPMLRSVLPEFPAEQTLQPEDVAATIFALCQPPWQHATGSVIDVVR